MKLTKEGFIDISSPRFDTRPAAIEKKRQLEINWLLRLGQTEQGPEDFLRDLFSDFLAALNSPLDQQLDESFSPPSPIPSNIKRKFSHYFKPDPQSMKSWLDRQIMGIKTWPPHFPISEKEKADILADAHYFLKGLTVFIEEVKKGILEARKQDLSTSSVSMFILQAPSLIRLDIERDGIFHFSFEDIDIGILGVTTCIKLLDGYPWTALKVCPQCEKVFFSLSQRQKFCSAECNSKAKYQKRIHKADYHESRRLIARKHYLKKEKYMNDTEIAEIWRCEGIGEKWIKRLLPEAS